MLLAAWLYIHKVTRTTTVSKVTREYVEEGRSHILQDKQIPDYVTLYRIHGPFLFGAAEKVQEIGDELETLSPIVILRLRNMTAIDATGLLSLTELADKLHASGRRLIVCGARPQPAMLLRQAKFERQIGVENICPNIETALERAKALFETLPAARRSA